MESENESDHSDIGTPRYYSECMYRFYVELADCSQTTKKLIEAFLPQQHWPRVEELTHGFEFEMPIQCAPDLVRHLMGNNIAVYQLVRIAKVEGRWREQ